MRYLLSVSSVAMLAFALSAGVAPAPHARAAVSESSFPGMPDTLDAVPSASVIQWKGAKLGGLGTYEGAVPLARGVLVLRHGHLASGTFTADMRGVQVKADPRHTLRDQVRSADFFDVERIPTAVFVATGATRAGDASYRVTGDLTLHGITRPVSFLADTRWPEVGHMIATSVFSIDRQQFGIGGRRSGAGVVNAVAGDEIQLSITLDARRRTGQVAQR
jgi:polyisoprenoid-binding protein YceI